eukprot:TRINITY_DN14486_c0_g1_i1.p1 TRINITY_DN14486_c0_g1~~TRINITY_DN14486_c0_g1_i1.p1  ORF type:complete len:166 (-),score=36.56 TRINITY_DN14486_c0_g1_i1:85-510(-)
MKKRGFGVGKWNGPGGKQDKEDVDILHTAQRECQEEVGVKPLDLQNRGSIFFVFPHQPSWSNHCHIFSSSSWEGEICESEEMKPEWFDIENIPWKSMWDDDHLWLPEVIKGNSVHWTFWFDEEGKVAKSEPKLEEGEISTI